MPVSAAICLPVQRCPRSCATARRSQASPSASHCVRIRKSSSTQFDAAELKTRTDTSGEASLRGHLKHEGDEQTGSQSTFRRIRRTTRRSTPRSHPRHPKELGLPAESQDGGPELESRYRPRNRGPSDATPRASYPPSLIGVASHSLLRARRERPRGCRAAECSQQFPPPDGDCQT